MFTDNLYKDQQQVLEIFDVTRTPKPQIHRRLKKRLTDVILGRRPMLRVYSATLKTDFWFINEGLVSLSDLSPPGKVITMEMLAAIMTDECTLVQTVQQILSGKPQ